jgi:peptidoglycan/xylan/chitin deacetylase (PgdA/CDA1 family)
MTKLMIIWDYDTPLARITATKPYNYVFESCLEEEGHVARILDAGRQLGARFTFAVLGFGAEASVSPFDVRHIIRRIAAEGHEIASHSWKHEWLPHLTKYQLDKTVERSKMILEECIGGNQVNGFVPPHDRPMSWYSRFALSAGDRGLYPFFPGASIDGVAESLVQHGYKWMRVNYRPLWQKLIDWKGVNVKLRLERKFSSVGGFHFVPEHAMEFGESTISALRYAVREKKPLVVAGHPGAFSFRPENLDNFNRFMEIVSGYIASGELKTITVSEYLHLQ